MANSTFVIECLLITDKADNVTQKNTCQKAYKHQQTQRLSNNT